MEIFADASEIENPADRTAFLDSACAGNAAVRQKVEGLLSAHEAVGEASGFLRGRQQDGTDADLAGEGGTVGRYKLLQKIGEGGWGIVYMAEQTEPVRRKVALKIIKPGMDSRQVLARFEAERQALAMMDHPNIARVLDAGATEHGRPYFVMELVRGIRITDYCDKNRLTMPERLELFIQVCQAVQHAHQKGIIHRDIKPSNILVTSDDGRVLPKVIDFGVAKATADIQLTDKTLFTRFEMFVGTPAYMSPEQAEFSAQGVDTRTDIYALGVLLYELLTGQTPFDGQTLISSGVDAMRRTIREQEPQKPSTRLRLLDGKTVQAVAAQRKSERGHLVAAVKGDLDWIVLKALEKDRTRRYETANGLAMDVQRCLNSEPVSARPPSTVYVLSKWARRHRAAFLGAAAVFAVLVLGVIVSTWLAVRAMRAEDIQRELRAKSDAERVAADAARNEALARAYAADMKAVSVALTEGNSGQANALLDRHVPHAGEPDGRGFEWSILKSRAAGDEAASFDQTGMNAGVAAAADGSWIAAAEKFGPVRVWETKSGQVLHEFPALQTSEASRAVAVSPDGSMLAYLGDTSIWVRGTAEWQVLRELPGRGHAVAFSPDGLLVWCSADKVQFVNPQTFTVAFEIPGIAFRDSATLTFSRDGKRMAVLDRDRNIEVWNIEARQRLTKIEAKDASTAAISPDGKSVASGDGGGSLRLWDADTGEKKLEVKAHSAWLLSIAFSPDGNTLATGGGDQMIRLWALSAAAWTAAESSHLRGHWNEVWSVIFTPNGHLLSGGKDAKVKLWPRTPGTSRTVTLSVPQPCYQNGFVADGELVCVRQPDHLAFFRTRDGAPAGEWKIPADYVSPQFELRRGDEAWFCATDGAVHIHELPSGKRLRTVPGAEHPAAAVAGVSTDGTLLATVQKGKPALQVRRVADGSLTAELPDAVTGPGDPSWTRASFSPDGSRIAYAASGRRAIIYDIARHTVRHELKEFAWHVYGTAWSSDGSALVVSCWDGTVGVWNPETGQRALPLLRGHFSGVPALSFSRDSRTLVTQGAEGAVRFWNLATGTEVLMLNDALGFWGSPISPDGRTLFWQRQSDGAFQIETAR